MATFTLKLFNMCFSELKTFILTPATPDAPDTTNRQRDKSYTL